MRTRSHDRESARPALRLVVPTSGWMGCRVSRGATDILSRFSPRLGLRVGLGLDTLIHRHRIALIIVVAVLVRVAVDLASTGLLWSAWHTSLLAMSDSRAR